MENADYRIEVLSGSFDAFGMVIDLLSRHAPFSDWPISRLARPVRRQLQSGRHVAALSPNSRLIAYAGWTPTLRATAELWVEERGPLQVLEKGHDAMAMTIVVSEQPIVTKALLRRARDLNPDMHWYFKRSYGDQLRESRKQSLFDRSARGEDTSWS